MIDFTPENTAAIDRALETRSVSASYHPSQHELAELFVGRTSSSGVAVTEQTALTYAAVWRAVTLIAQTAASAPLHVYRKRVTVDGQETRDALPNHPAEYLLNVEANVDLDSYTLRECMNMHALTWGTGAAEIIRRGDGVPLELDLLLPWNYTPERSLDGRLFYRITRDDGTSDYVHSSNILSVIGPSPDGICGYSPIRLARESIGVGLAAERFGAAFFGKGARPGGVLEHPSTLSEDAIARLKKSFIDQHAGSGNSGKTLVLEEGMKFNPLTIPPEEAQFLESRQFQVSEIARWFGVPPHMLFDLTKSTFNNIEEQGLDFLTYSLSPWTGRWERAARRRLLAYSERRDCYLDTDTDAIVRTNTAVRDASFKAGREGGWLTINDILRKLNKPTIGPEGDKYLVPLNHDTVGAKSDPAADATTSPATPTDPATPAQRSALRSAIEDALRLAVGRAVRLHANAAQRAAKKPAEFASWLDEFAREHRRLAEDVLLPYARVAVAGLGLAESSGQLTDRAAEAIVAESRRRLLDVAERSAGDQLAAAVEAETAGWDQRAASTVSTLFAVEAPQ